MIEILFLSLALIVNISIIVWLIVMTKRTNRKLLKRDEKMKQANQVMHDYERDVFGWWGGNKKKADAMTADEIKRDWEEHQKRLRDLELF